MKRVLTILFALGLVWSCAKDSPVTDGNQGPEGGQPSTSNHIIARTEHRDTPVFSVVEHPTGLGRFSIKCAAYGNGLYVFGTTRGRVITTRDFQTFNLSTDYGYTWYFVEKAVYADGKWRGLVNDGYSNHYLLVSNDDGLTWGYDDMPIKTKYSDLWYSEVNGKWYASCVSGIYESVTATRGSWSLVPGSQSQWTTGGVDYNGRTYVVNTVAPGVLWSFTDAGTSMDEIYHFGTTYSRSRPFIQGDNMYFMTNLKMQIVDIWEVPLSSLPYNMKYDFTRYTLQATGNSWSSFGDNFFCYDGLYIKTFASQVYTSTDLRNWVSSPIPWGSNELFVANNRLFAKSGDQTFISEVTID